MTREEALSELREAAAGSSPESRAQDVTSHALQRRSDGSYALPSVPLGRPAVRLLEALRVLGYEHPPFDWVSWKQCEQPGSAAWIAAADRDGIAKFVLATKRFERFCDGFIDELMDDGTFASIAARVLELEA